MKNFIIKSFLKSEWISKPIINYFAKNKLPGVGKVIDLKVDFKNKELRCSVKLNGEVEPISLSATGMELTKEGAEYYVTVQSATASREWIQAIINLKVGEKIRIDEKIYKTLTGLFGK